MMMPGITSLGLISLRPPVIWADRAAAPAGRRASAASAPAPAPGRTRSGSAPMTEILLTLATIGAVNFAAAASPGPAFIAQTRTAAAAGRRRRI